TNARDDGFPLNPPYGPALLLLSDQAAAKVNLTLRVLGKRADGYHDLESLVVFARQVGDQVVLRPAEPPGLCVDGPTAAAAGDMDVNLVMRAAHTPGQLLPRLP